MPNIRNIAFLLAFLPVMGVAAACSDRGDDRAALEDEELDRDLNMALQGDTAAPLFQDTATGVQPLPGTVDAPAPAPSVAPPAQRAPAQQTPARTAQRPSAPAPAPAPQQPRANPSPRTVTTAVPSGTTMELRLNQTLSTETNAVGDPFTATLSEAILAADGSTIIPAGSVVRGRVTAVDKSDRVGETAVIKLAFESISVGGRSYPMDATVVDTEPQRKTRTTAKEQAAKVAAGAAAGAVIGQVLGKNTGSTLKGAAVGAAAGTAIAMGTADVDVVLPSGSRMVIKVDTPVEVSRTIS